MEDYFLINTRISDVGRKSLRYLATDPVADCICAVEVDLFDLNPRGVTPCILVLGVGVTQLESNVKRESIVVKQTLRFNNNESETIVNSLTISHVLSIFLASH